MLSAILVLSASQQLLLSSATLFLLVNLRSLEAILVDIKILKIPTDGIDSFLELDIFENLVCLVSSYGVISS